MKRYSKKECCKNVDRSSLRAQWQNGPYKITHTEQHKNTQNTKTQHTFRINCLNQNSIHIHIHIHLNTLGRIQVHYYETWIHIFLDIYHLFKLKDKNIIFVELFNFLVALLKRVNGHFFPFLLQKMLRKCKVCCIRKAGLNPQCFSLTVPRR